ncbi:MAG: SPOR domain-containing protein [Cecembia sp.]
MAEENKDKLPEQNENDYGFPFVEVTPLKAKTSKKPPKEKETPVAITEVEPNEEGLKIEKKITGHTSENKRRKSHLPLQFSLVMLILIILGAMAYFLYFLPETEPAPVVSEVEEPVEEVVEAEMPLETEEEPSIAFEEEDMAEAVIEQIVEEPQSAPVVSAQTSGRIFQVRERSTPEQYHIIIASMPSEQVAKDRAEDLVKANRDVWIIYPYGEISNYRLSIGKYPAFADASQALENLKVEFGASIWILKY